jgi:3-hydroxyacyl-CoA dehydrogenase
MDNQQRSRVAVIGAGHRGRAWAALALSRGWLVSLYDAESPLLQRASEDVGDRVRRLTDLGRADPLTAAGALSFLRVGRSLLNAVGDADWILEIMPLDLAARQRLLEQIEQVAPPKTIMVSLTRTMPASALCGRLRRPERFLCAYAMDPIELIPLVEIVPGPNTDPACTAQVQTWLEALDRKPVVLRKEVAGNATGRISAAVWRECIDLVLEGVVALEDVDRLVSLGPAIEWTIAGPYLSEVMNAGDGGANRFLSESIQAHEALWGKLARWQNLSSEDRQRLIRSIERAYGDKPAELREQRDRFMARLLQVMEQSDDGPSFPIGEEPDATGWDI